MDWTREELKIFEECPNETGLARVGKYPAKKDLINGNILYTGQNIYPIAIKKIRKYANAHLHIKKRINL